MRNWEAQSVNFGTTKENKTIHLEFKSLPEIPEIDRIIPACGCTEPTYDKAKGILKVKYNAGRIPKQVQGSQIVTKRIDIFYKDGTAESLFINGVKIR